MTRRSCTGASTPGPSTSRRPGHRLCGAPQRAPGVHPVGAGAAARAPRQGRLGDAIDTAAVVGTMFGVATSLGLGVIQISAGLEFLGVVDASTTVQVLTIVAVTSLATLSVVSGVGRGIKWLSNVNMGLAGALLLFVLLAGPTLFLLRDFVQSLGVYAQNVLRLTFDVTAFQGEAGEAWQAGGRRSTGAGGSPGRPFVGVFIARISRGRTVREFVAGVLLVPTALTFLWFSVLGGTALFRELSGDGGLVVERLGRHQRRAVRPARRAARRHDRRRPGGPAHRDVLRHVVGLGLAGRRHARLRRRPRPAHVEPGAVGRAGGRAGDLLALAASAGGLVALQTASIVVALPFSIVMIGICVATVRAFRTEHRALLRQQERLRREELAGHVAAALSGEEPAADARREPAGHGLSAVRPSVVAAPTMNAPPLDGTSPLACPPPRP